MKTVIRKRDLFLLLVCVVILAGIPAVAADETAISVTTLPLSIIENVGQKDPSVLFHADAAGHAIFFTADEVLLARMDQESGTSSIVGIGLAGSDPGAEVKGIDPLAGKANFFIGSDPSGWFTAVPMYGGVAYEEILPGVDLLFKGDQGMLKREFVLAPATDPRTVVMKYRGHKSLALDDSGRLLVATSTGVLTETAPYAYQEIHGKQVGVACRYVILGENRVGFVLGEYNGAFPVVIDPYLEYSTYFGGWGEEIGYGVDVDDTGCAYITGSIDTTNIVIPSHSTYQETLAGGKDAFVAKFSADGIELEQFTYFGGAYDDIGTGIAVDANYQAYITGYTDSSDLPMEGSPSQPTKSNCTDAFLAQFGFTVDSSTLIGSTYFGGNDTDRAYGIYLDSTDGPVITGYTASSDLPIGGTPVQGALAGGLDAFVARFTDTSTLSYSTYHGGEQNDVGYGVALDSSDYIFVTGKTRSLLFPTVTGSLRRSLRGTEDAFITKFNPTLSSLTYSTYLGGYGYDGGRGIAVDPAGDAYVTGYTDSPTIPEAYTFPLKNPYQSTYGGGSSSSLHYGDAFITKMNHAGSALNYSTYLGGRGNEVGYAIAVDNLTRAHVTGWTDSMDFPTERALYDSLNGIKPDAFIAQLSAEGNILDFSTYFGGSYYDEGYGIHSDDAGNVTITGYTQSPVDFPTLNAYQDQLAGSPSIRNADAFVSRIARIIPVASFTADPTIGFVPLSVDFTDTSTGDPINWDWEFGDGGTDTVQNPTHLYEVVGNYTVNLTVCNLDGCDNTSGIIYVGPELIPDFEANETSGCRDLIVNFTDLTTPVFGDYGEPTNKTWDFGDGNVTEVTTDQFIIHTYTEAGVYNVTLNVTSFFGMAVHTKDAYIAVNETPVADFTSNATIGFAPLTVQFEDNSTGYPGPSSWYWEFGSGEGTSTLQNPLHTYTTAGNYTVNFSAINGCGTNWSNMTDYIMVGEPLVANFTANSTNGYRPFTVNFTDSSLPSSGDYAPTAWSWDFGDGNVTPMTTNASILHTYTTYGVFDVSLNVSNMYGFDVLTRTDYITVAVIPDLYFVPDPPVPDTDPVIIPTNDNTSISMYLELAEFGLSGYNMTVYFDDSNAANITNVTFPSWAGTRSLDSSLPAPTIHVKAADTGDQVQPGDTDILMLTFLAEGLNEMPAEINVTINKMNTDTGGDLVTHVIPCEVRIVDLLLIPDPYVVGLPTDPDGDQLYWDLNGNGEIDFPDLILYFNYMWWIEANEPIVLFDYNGNGNIDFNDLILLYNKIMA